jgi:FecR protein
MRTPGYLAPLLFGLLTVAATPAQTTSQNQTPPPPHPPSSATYPQIVRIRYLEGDVRIARGKQDEKATDADWEQAVANLPLETGFSLVTGTGRAEIEFEDASTLFLADNSALSFDDLHTTAGVPHTEITLLTGTATLHLYPAFPGQSFLLKTPTDSITMPYPDKAYLRVTSFLDAIAVTPLIAVDPQKDVTFNISGSAPQDAPKGKTVFYNNGAPIPSPPGTDSTASTEWDTWVARRLNARSSALAAVSKASGLPPSIPGLADMSGQGSFFPCAPYGTCWLPPADDSQPPPADNNPPILAPGFDLVFSRTSVGVNPGGKIKLTLAVADTLGFSGNVTLSSTLPPGFTCILPCSGPLPQAKPSPLQLLVDPTVPPGTYTVLFTGNAGALEQQAILTVTVTAETLADFDLPIFPDAAPIPFFPCAPYGVHFLSRNNRLTGRPRILDLGFGIIPSPYAWTVCHTGTWLFRQNRYIWVADRKRHHHPPIRWVKHGHRFGYVPLHPRDVAGSPARNGKHEVYCPTDKDHGRKNDSFEAIEFKLGDKYDSLTSPPKEFRKPYTIPLAPSKEPTIAAHQLKDAHTPGKQAGLPLTFDHKKHGFQLVTQGPNGSRSIPIRQPFPGHNSTLQTRNGNVQPRGNRLTPTTSHPPAAGSHAPAPMHTSSGASHAAPSPHTGGGGAPHAGGHH